MATAIMTSKGQLTVPKEVRARLQLVQGDRVEFFETSPGVFALRQAKRDISTLKGMFKTSRRPVTVDEMNGALAKYAKRRK